MELDKTTVELNDIITATIKINNIPKFCGFQINIKFDPEILQAVDPISGKPYNNSTLPLAGELLNNSEYLSFGKATNDLENGILNISKSYLNLEEYKKNGIEENTGSIAIIGFKVIKAKDTSIYFQNSQVIPDGLNGTIIFDWDGNRVNSGYEVKQPPSIKVKIPSTPTVVNTPTPTTISVPTDNSSSTPKPTETPTATPTKIPMNGYISMDFDKNKVQVGDIIKATISIKDIDNFAGYHVNIEYDPNILMPVDPNTGIPYRNNTFPMNGNVLQNNIYMPFEMANNDIDKGVLNFSKVYFNLDAYRRSGKAESSGTLAIIGFRALKEGNTYVYFENTSSLPNAIKGTVLFDWNGNSITSGYSVIQPNSVILIKPTSTNTPTPTATPTKTPTPTATPTKTPTPLPTGFEVRIEAESAAYDQEITIPIKFRNVPSNGIITTNITIEYDPNKLRYIETTAGNIVINPRINFASNKEKDGIIRLLFLDETLTNEYIKYDGVFANLKFKVITSNRTTSTIKITKANFGDIYLKPVSATLTDGTIKLNYSTTPTKTPSSTPTKTPTPTPTRTPATRTPSPARTVVEPTSNIPAGARIGEHKAYLRGYTDGCFRPQKEITRAEAAAIIAKFVNTSSLPNYNNVSFPDVSNDHWAKEFIEIVARAGLFQGYPDGKFRPDDTIKRGEFATVIYKLLDLKPSSSLSNNFTDIDKHWAKNYILELANLKYVNGYSDKTFRPENKIKRDECVVMVNRALKRGPLNGAKLEFTDVPENYWAYKDIAEGALDHKYYIDYNGEEVLIK